MYPKGLTQSKKGRDKIKYKHTYLCSFCYKIRYIKLDVLCPKYRITEKNSFADPDLYGKGYTVLYIKNTLLL